MREIPLTQGKAALVDDADYERVMAAGPWCHSNGYAVKGHNGISMHRFLSGLVTGDGKKVDHKNRNGLDNRRRNLRVCTDSQNQANRRRSRNNNSGFKGVSFHRASGKYQAKIKVAGRMRWLGLFADPADAALAYNEAALKYHGEFARLNDIPLEPDDPACTRERRYDVSAEVRGAVSLAPEERETPLSPSVTPAGDAPGAAGGDPRLLAARIIDATPLFVIWPSGQAEAR